MRPVVSTWYVVFYKDQFSLSAGDARVTLYLETTRAFMFNKAFPSKLASSSLLVLVPPSRSTRGPGGGQKTQLRRRILLCGYIYYWQLFKHPPSSLFRAVPAGLSLRQPLVCTHLPLLLDHRVARQREQRGEVRDDGVDGAVSFDTARLGSGDSGEGGMQTLAKSTGSYCGGK